MKMNILKACIPVMGFLFLIGCTEKSGTVSGTKPYVIYGEYATKNDTMKNGLNRRMFDSLEVDSGGTAIKYQADGSFALEPGTYRVTGFSVVTMQTAFGLPVMKDSNTYPGYCLAYYREDEAQALQKMISVGSPGTAYTTTPSLFDFVIHVDTTRYLCIGHQVGEDLHHEVFMSVADVVGAMPSMHHLFARIAITKL
jgi:hypothetical protein